MRIIYPQTLKLQSVINNPRVNGIIKECGGKMLMIEKQGKRALEQMFEAFKCYQEIGDSVKAKTLLKYTILGSIISDDSLDYSSTNESKVFKSDPEIQACIAIR